MNGTSSYGQENALTLDERRAGMLTFLIKEHKALCDDPECRVVTSLFIKVVEDLQGHVLTATERELFL